MGKIVILYLTDSFNNFAGAERNLFEVAARINPHKFKPVVVCLRGGRAAELLREKGVEVLDLKINRIYTLSAIIKAFGLLRLIKRQDVKIIVTYHESSDFLGLILAKLAKVPAIISSRRDMGYKLNKRHVFIYKIIDNLFDKIITVSDAVKNIIFNRENALWCKMVTIYNGVQFDKFNKLVDAKDVKKSLGLKNDQPVIGILAVLRPIKGHKYLLEAAPLILKQFPSAYFLFVGWCDKKSDYYKELKSIAKKLNIEEKVVFAGGYSDITEIISAIDVPVFPSINEGFSNAILECMAAGKPVVATNTGGTPEAVIGGETGILIPPKDVDALAAAVLKLLTNKEMAVAMGRAGQIRVKEFFDINKMVSNIENLYMALLSESEEKAKLFCMVGIKGLKRLVINIIKILISDIMYYTGLIVLIRKVKGKNIPILSYHRVNDNCFDPLDMNIKPENFERHIRHIRKKYNIISLEEACKFINKKKNIPNNIIVITFDDGYKDNYTNAFPILKKYAIPATIFLCAGAIDKRQMFWFDRVVSAFKQTTHDVVNLEKINLGLLDISLISNKYLALQKTVQRLKAFPSEKQEEFIEFLLKELEVNINNINNCDLMSWDEVLEMKEGGITFENHGLGHSILTILSDKDLDYELIESKRIIKQNANINVKFFAYPNGGASDFDLRAESILKQHNYVAAFTLLEGVNNIFSNLYELKRVCVNKGRESDLRGHFSAALLEASISGIFNIKSSNLSKSHKLCLI